MSIEDRWKRLLPAQQRGKRWEVRYRSGGVQRKRRFDTKKTAEDFEARQRLDPDVRAASEGRRLTVDQMMETWLATKRGLKPKTQDAYATDVREILTEFSGRLAPSLRHSDVARWAARDRGVSLRTRSLIALAGAYKIAIADGLLRESPTAKVDLPRSDRTDQRYLTWEQLEDLADKAEPYTPLVWLLGTVGLRLGEAVGLQVGDVNPARRRIRVARQVTNTAAGPVVGAPKGGRPREVPVPGFVLEQLPVLDRAKSDWLFTGQRGGRLDANWWRSEIFQQAAAEVGLGKINYATVDGRQRRSYEGIVPHEMRHTAASLAIAEGADVMAVQRMLGHKSASITLTIYSHLWDAGLDAVAERVHLARAEGRMKGTSEVSRAH